VLPHGVSGVGGAVEDEEHVSRGRCAQLDQTWARSPLGCAARAALLRGLFHRGLLAWYTERRVEGTERVAAVDGPAVFVANHQSHIDTPIILNALPGARRRRTVVAAAADYFYADRRKAAVVSLTFGTVPVMREGGGSDELDHVHALLDSGWSVLVYPEGTRAKDKSEGRLRTGAAVLAAQHGVPLVPIHLTGTDRAMPRGQAWPKRKLWQRRHQVRVAFGQPVRPAAPEARRDAIDEVRRFFAAQERDQAREPARA